MGGAGPEREGIYAVSASDVRKDKKAKEKAPLFLHGIEPQGHKWSCPLCPCWGARGEVSGPLWTVLSPQEQALMCPLSLSAAFPGKEDMAKAQVTLRTLLSVQILFVRERESTAGEAACLPWVPVSSACCLPAWGRRLPTCCLPTAAACRPHCPHCRCHPLTSLSLPEVITELAL